MGKPICVTCGVQRDVAVEACPICVDERLDIGWSGQSRTTLGQMQAAGYRNRIEEVEPDLWGIGTNPTFAVGQRSLLVTLLPGVTLIRTGGPLRWQCGPPLGRPG